jgi:nucleotide-binding universal stress UspA family protein
LPGICFERIPRDIIVFSPSITSDRIDLKSVLVATDLTAASDKAFQHGIAIARHYRSPLYIVHVVSSLGITLAGPEAVQIAAEVTERDLDRLVNKLVMSGKHNGVEIHPIVLKGNIDEQMDSFARAHRVDLIVVGTHGRQGMDRLLFGSVAQLISKYSCSPVLTVGPHTSAPWLDDQADPERPLLFATAFDNASAKAIPYAITMANDFERQLNVLHVMPPHHTYLLHKDRVAHENVEAAAREHLSALIRPSSSLQHAANFLIEFGDPADGILRTASRIQAAAIIMGTHRDSLSDLIVRLPWAIAHRINREAKCPVLTVRG